MNMGSRICGELDTSGVVDVCSNNFVEKQTFESRLMLS